VKLCTVCASSLKDGKLPKFSLANHLYYAVDRLPQEVGTAFSDATLLERFLVARARASRVTFRYCKGPDACGFGDSPITSQAYNKGNFIVYPQDSLSLNSVLPPSLEGRLLRYTGCHKVTKERGFLRGQDCPEGL
jgi:hypothetical protein